MQSRFFGSCFSEVASPVADHQTFKKRSSPILWNSDFIVWKSSDAQKPPASAETFVRYLEWSKNSFHTTGLLPDVGCLFSFGDRMVKVPVIASYNSGSFPIARAAFLFFSNKKEHIFAQNLSPRFSILKEIFFRRRGHSQEWRVYVMQETRNFAGNHFPVVYHPTEEPPTFCWGLPFWKPQPNPGMPGDHGKILQNRIPTSPEFAAHFTLVWGFCWWIHRIPQPKSYLGLCASLPEFLGSRGPRIICQFHV